MDEYRKQLMKKYLAKTTPEIIHYAIQFKRLELYARYDQEAIDEVVDILCIPRKSDEQKRSALELLAEIEDVNTHHASTKTREAIKTLHEKIFKGVNQ